MAGVIYPDVCGDFLNAVNVLNFDLAWVPRFSCAVDINFHYRLVMSTIGPFVFAALLAVTFAVARRKNQGGRNLQKVLHKHLSMGLLVTFLVYSSVSATVFQTFACDGLDNGKTYLRVDYRIECDSLKHRVLQGYAAFMILVYAIGIPLIYAVALYKTKDLLNNEPGRRSARAELISELWTPYKPERYYYEVIECVRRLCLTGIIVFIYPNSAAQLSVTLLLAVFFWALSENRAPYNDKWETWISRTGHAVVVLSMFMALSLKVDVSDESHNSQQMFAYVLVVLHVGLIIAVVLEGLVTFCSARQADEPAADENGVELRRLGP